MIHPDYQTHIESLDEEQLKQEFQFVKRLRNRAYDAIYAQGFTFDSRVKVLGYKTIVETNQKIDIILTHMKQNIFNGDFLDDYTLPHKK